MILKFQVVTRRALNQKDIFVQKEKIALGSGTLKTVPCTKPEEKKRGRPCQTCQLTSGTSSVTNNNRTVKTEGRNYAVNTVCIVYVGKTLTTLSDRNYGHRSSYSYIPRSSKQDKLFDLNKPDSIDDENVLATFSSSIETGLLRLRCSFVYS